ncbi:MAG: hypothetical protein OXC95_08410 [Dehalococcoidia bacterium]|nr:hypothetical protein [Dehalococcoidia bacterium]
MHSQTSGTTSSSLVTVNVEDLLRFFDEKPDWSEKHATGIVGIVGEDLNAACFQHYLESEGARSAVLRDPDSRRPLPVTTGNRKGPRLDRWIEVVWADGSKTVFQTEIKNWSAHAIGGKTLATSATPEEVTNYKRERWKLRWDECRRTLPEALTAKVMVRMKSPGGVDEESIRPLLIFWEAMGRRGQEDDHLLIEDHPTCDFPFELPSSWPKPNEFPDLWIFSVSSYLRSIPDAIIKLDMPEAARRLRILDKLFSTST